VNVRLFLFLSVLFASLSKADARGIWPPAPVYAYQVGATFGVNRVSVGRADFPGTHWGVYARAGKHAVGFRREWDGEFVKLWGEPLYYSRSGLYYGRSAAYRYVQWEPEVGVGMIEYNHPTTGGQPSQPIEEGFFAEIAVKGSVNVRGNGIGARVFLNINRFVPILGATLYLQFGFAWNAERTAESTDTGFRQTMRR
jgi:hypothetical protein